MSSLRSTRIVSGRIQAHAHVHLHAADRRQIVALGVEEELAEQGLGGVERGRLARTHDAVDVDQRLLAGVVLVHRQGVADIGADRDAVDVDDFDFVEAGFRQGCEIVGGQLVAGFDIDLARFGIDHVERARSGRSVRPRRRRCS